MIKSETYCEERVLLELLSVRQATAESLGRIFDQQLVDEILDVR